MSRPDVILRNKSLKQRLAVSAAWKRPESSERKRKIGEANKTALLGNKCHWKGDAVGYGGLHDWVRDHLGTPQRCEECGTEEVRKYEWANISKTYKRDLADWKRLCVPCHHRFDDIHKKIWVSRRRTQRFEIP